MLVFRLFRCQYVQCVPRDSIMTDQPTFMGCEPDRMGLELRAPWSAPIITNLDFRFGFPNFIASHSILGWQLQVPVFNLTPWPSRPSDEEILGRWRSWKDLSWTPWLLCLLKTFLVPPRSISRTWSDHSHAWDLTTRHFWMAWQQKLRQEWTSSLHRKLQIPRGRLQPWDCSSF